MAIVTSRSPVTDPAVAALTDNTGVAPAPVTTPAAPTAPKSVPQTPENLYLYRVDGVRVDRQYLKSDAKNLVATPSGILKFIVDSFDDSILPDADGNLVPFDPAALLRQFENTLISFARMTNPANSGETLHIPGGIVSDDGKISHQLPPLRVARELAKAGRKTVAAIKASIK